jgi:hypothetical protein
MQNPETFRAIASSARLIKQVEFNNNGLIILKALYGDIIHFGEPEPSTSYRPGKCVDIAMQLQANVIDSQLHLISRTGVAEPLHKRNNDIPNPNGTEKKQMVKNRLAITYWFDGDIHYCTYNDNEDIILPMQDHYCDMIEDNGEYPDLLKIAQDDIPHWLHLLPSSNDDEDFEILGEDWDSEPFNYKQVPSFFPSIDSHGKRHKPRPMRPEGVLSEPRFIVYERQKRFLENTQKKQLIMGFSVASVVFLAALQFGGIIDVTGWPGINMVFGNSNSNSGETTTGDNKDKNGLNNIQK